MTTPHHHLLTRSDTEVLWFRRRSVVQAAGWWLASGGWTAARAQQRSNVVSVHGDVLHNGQPLQRDPLVVAGDRIETGPDSTVVFTVGNSAFQVRQNTRLSLEGDEPLAVKALRILAGGVASVWGPGRDRQVQMPTITAGIRGTGVYAEVFPEQDYRSYLCNCYGTIDLAAGTESLRSESTYHQAFWGEWASRNGRTLTPAGAINHTDEELEFLAGLVQQRTAWQISGHKGSKEGGSNASPSNAYGPPGTKD